MIKKLYIIKETGPCIYFLNFENASKNLVKNPNYFSGIFSVIMKFAEILLDGENNAFGKLSLNDMNYYFLTNKGLHYILETEVDNDNFSDYEYYYLLSNIGDHFEQYLDLNNIDISFLCIEEDIHLAEQFKNKFSFFSNQFCCLIK